MLDKLKNINKLTPKKGRVLISGPFLDDAYFKRSVILLCEFNEEGAFGFILNNVMKIELQELLEDYEADGFNVSLGGPVQTSNLYYLHTLGDKLPGSIEVLDGVYMGGEFELIKSMLHKGDITEKDIRFFLGYSGWEKDQLETELNSNSWVIVENVYKKEIIEKSCNSFWKEKMLELGGNYSIWSNAPENPSYN